MVIYDQEDIFTLFDFGIQIPVSESRVTKTFDQLKSHRILGEKIRDWHIDRVEAEITKSDLLRVHSKAYVERLYSVELENEIIRAYHPIEIKGNATIRQIRVLPFFTPGRTGKADETHCQQYDRASRHAVTSA